MASSRDVTDGGDSPDDEDAGLLDASEAAEEIIQNDEDHPMDSDPDEDLDAEQEIQLQNDSIAHFDGHTDSIFSITSHPTQSDLIATGGGDDTTFVWSTAQASRPLPLSYESGAQDAGRASLPAISKLTGHTDSVNALTYSLPSGDYLVTGGLDGRLRVHDASQSTYPLLAEAQEVPEINFLATCPSAQYPNTIALGASDGSVWVYTIDRTDTASPLQVRQAYYLHTESCTAGAWTPDGKLLATVSEDGSLYVWDPFGDASEAGIASTSGGQALVGLTAEDARFTVEGGLYCAAVAPNGAFVVVGGAGGMIRVVGLPRLGSVDASATQGKKGGGAKNKSGGSRQSTSAEGASAGQAGQILASLKAHSDSVETLAFSPAPTTLLAAGSVDGNIAIFDTAHRFAIRRLIKEAHEGFATVKVEFGKGQEGHVLTSCGLDGVVRRWDTRGGTAAAAQGLIGEKKGHRGDGEGVLGFTIGGGNLVTAGDDGVSLVFRANS